uniref:Uncharacterized protein n=1 Tax=Meloidogyne enterolobii TaxID=390850 RepID=A0A6V7VPR1_MELEN|nr:unnamed protein product [Meloidogyne enterolobii]
MLEKTNFSTIARFVNESLRQIGISEEKVLLLVTDAAAYMCKAARALNVFYPNCIHVTCACHALHRVAEEIRCCFSELYKYNELDLYEGTISGGNIQGKFPALPLPPQPILTRWSSWLEATIFYSNNFHAVKDVVDSFDSLDAAAIVRAKELFNNKRITQQLAYINANFSLIPNAIRRLEAQGLKLAEALNILTEVKELLAAATGEIGEKIQKKFDNVLEKNPGIGKLIEIAKVLNGEESDVELPPSIIEAMKFAPLQSCDVERSFSVYKNILTDKRTNFTPENLEMYLICNCEKRD